MFHSSFVASQLNTTQSHPDALTYIRETDVTNETYIARYITQREEDLYIPYIPFFSGKVDFHTFSRNRKVNELLL